MNNSVQPTSFCLYYLAWEESEKGWGVRPDGYSLHVSEQAGNDFVKAHNESLPVEIPSTYTRPYSGKFHLMEVSAGLYALVHSQPNGSIRRWDDICRYPLKDYDVGPELTRRIDLLNTAIRGGRKAARAKKSLLKRMGQFLPT